MVRKLLITAIVILSLILTALLGFIWYQSTHFYVEGEAYANGLEELDLRDREVSEAHYLQVRAQLPNCRIYWNVPFQGGFLSSDTQELTLTTLSQEDLRVLTAYFDQLRRIDATGCQEYGLLVTLAEQLPGCEVAYQIALGGVSAASDVRSLTLEPGSYDIDTLIENLPYLTQLESVHFQDSQLPQEQKAWLQAEFPQVSFTASVRILGQEYDDTVTSLDLTALTSADVADVAAQLPVLGQLEEIRLSDGHTDSQLSLAEVKTLMDAAPNASIDYSCQFYGISISTADEEIKLSRITVGETDLAQELRELLDVMVSCKRLVLDDKGPYDKLWKSISDEKLAQLREEYRDRTKVVWRVYFGDNGSSLTDAEVIRAVYGLNDDNSKDLIYCENVRYLDVGHNVDLDYMEFLSGMKDLEVAILSGAPLKDLTPIGNCKNLKFLEIANCIYLPDISALKNCTQLEMLNISFTTFEDMSVLNELNLTHLTAVCSKFVSKSEPQEALQAFMEANPDCWTVYAGDQPYGVGWRYAEDDSHLPWYASMVEAFHYPNPYNNAGWYLK